MSPLLGLTCFFFFKQKTAYEMRISDWSSDVCSSDLARSGGLVDRLIGERARTADDADRALGEDVARHDTALAFVGRQHAWAVRPDQPRLGTGPRPVHLHHVQQRNGFVYAHDEIGRASSRERVFQYV